MGRATRLLIGLLLVAITCAAVMYIAFPQLIVSAMVSLARRAAAVERHVMEVDGHVIAYLEGGAGEPVVLLHGFGASKDVWNSVAAKLTPLQGHCSGHSWLWRNCCSTWCQVRR
jgi:hypothetical protein